MLAAIFGHDDTVAFLLNVRADVLLKDDLGLTAEQWAVRRGFPNIAQLIANTSPHQVPARANGTGAQAQSEAEPKIETASQRSGVEIETANDLNDAQQSEPHESRKGALGAAATAMLRARAASQMDLQTEAKHQDNEAAGSNGAAAPAQSRTEEEQTTAAVQSTTTQPEAVEARIEQDLTIEESPKVAESLTAESNTEETHRIDQETQPRQPITESPISASAAPSAAPPVIALPPISSGPRAARLSPLTPAAADTSLVPAVNLMPDSSDSESHEIARPKDISVPSFNSFQSAGSGRLIVWLLVVVTLGGSIFLAYRLSTYFSRRPTPGAASPVVEKKPEPTIVAARRISPVIGGALAGAELHVPDPEYPENAVAKNSGEAISGTVTVRVQVNRKGQVISASALDGDQRLQGAAVKAAKNTAFSPEKLANKSRIVTGTITYNFVAQPTEPTPAKVSAAPTQVNPPAATGSTSASGSARQTASDGDFPVAGGPLVGTEINLPKPDYPERVKSKGISGIITVVVRVNRAGKVISWRTLDGDPQLRAAALKAAKKATFYPGKLPGTGEIVGTITYNFKL